MTDTPAQTTSFVDRVTGLYKSKGLTGAAKAGFGDIKNIVGGEGTTWAQRGVGFGRVAGVGVGVAVAGNALFNSRSADGEERSMLGRLAQFIIGGGIAAGSLIAGRAR